MNHIQKLIAQHGNDTLAEEDGMVYQVWEDGEITLTKSGRLLGQRSLHTIESGWSGKSVPTDWFPHDIQEGKHGFIYTDNEGADAVRHAILTHS